jgi:hypothetical protein
VVLASCGARDDIAQTGQDAYRISVPTEAMSTVKVTIAASNGMLAHVIRTPDIAAANTQARQRATRYCAKMNKSMVVTAEGFDMGAGLTFTFNCVLPQAGAVHR